ncbi:MAG: hypothetical protein ACR2MC_09955 [Actinomycetota bacterium]
MTKKECNVADFRSARARLHGRCTRQALVAGITYGRTWQGPLYLAIVLDLAAVVAAARVVRV